MFFFGGNTNGFNPRSGAYCSGLRSNVVILDLVHSSLRLRRFISFLILASSKRIKSLFVLASGWESLFLRIPPYAFYAPRWVGGVLSNYSSTYFHFKRNKDSFFYTKHARYWYFLIRC